MSDHTDKERETILHDFYDAIDEKSWARVTGHLTPNCHWHVLENEVTGTASLIGREEIAGWFEAAIGDLPTHHEVIEVTSNENASTVFTVATVGAGEEGEMIESHWVDVFVFESSKISEHLSLQTR